MIAHRIGSAAYAGTKALAFGGQGSLYGDGRWHNRGRLATYVASHYSLAYVEVLALLQRGAAVQAHVSWTIEIPDALVAGLDGRALPHDWRKKLPLTRKLGDAWLASKAAVALRVPSAIIPNEWNLLLNPAHKDFDFGWIKSGPTPVEFDLRLL